MRPDESTLTWRKSSRSGGEGGNCVEVARLAAGVAVRDSKNTAGPVLRFAPTAWVSFLADLDPDGRLPG
ncbi:DUF397 domain-containing protein [Plantactinospora endophytica]|uniref:DUF397 domain-containing protein n=1 Tax=Plantactinospora endophytica TaxID=673535 RepID=A0ABQ4EAW0_9ACTN|nr:DUF397 domain-containing protein [Plantactinospora endophytica]GIG91854.1 hypothetical protein Pen02_67900 [Plantactinospora endophytica]